MHYTTTDVTLELFESVIFKRFSQWLLISNANNGTSGQTPTSLSFITKNAQSVSYLTKGIDKTNIF